MRRLPLNSAVSADNLVKSQAYFDEEFTADIQKLKDTVSDIQYVSNWLIKIAFDRPQDQAIYDTHAEAVNDAMLLLKNAIDTAVKTAEQADKALDRALDALDK